MLNDYEDADTNFLVKSITWKDEWLHSFFYYNEEIPTDEDFEKTIADYLSFEFDMKLHGRGIYSIMKLSDREWKAFTTDELFSIKSGTTSDFSKLNLKTIQSYRV